MLDGIFRNSILMMSSNTTKGFIIAAEAFCSHQENICQQISHCQHDRLWLWLRRPWYIAQICSKLCLDWRVASPDWSDIKPTYTKPDTCQNWSVVLGEEVVNRYVDAELKRSACRWNCELIALWMTRFQDYENIEVFVNESSQMTNRVLYPYIYLSWT